MGSSNARLILRAALPYVAMAVMAVGVLNFFWFMSETLPQNLIPSDSRVVDGHYFLWSKTHGGYIEVAKSFSEWVRFHETTLFLTWPLVLLSGGYLVFMRLRGVAAGQVSPAMSSMRVQQVRRSGPLLASSRTAGLVGTASFSRPLLRVDAFPGGIVVKPVFMAESAVLASEIVSVKPQGLSAQFTKKRRPILGLGASEVSESYRPRGPYVEIEHTGAGMASPVVIAGSDAWDIAQAIAGIAAAEPDAGTVREQMPSYGTSASGRRDTIPLGVRAGLGVVGVIVALGLLWAGITWAIPHLGPFGVFWTAGLVLILATNAWRFVRGRRSSTRPGARSSRFRQG